jgi:putative transposase
VGAGGAEGATYWHQVLSEILNRGTLDVCIIVCDGALQRPIAIATPGRYPKEYLF